jgi:hypothetical protein
MAECVGQAFLCHFGASKYVTKIVENKIHHGIRRPPDDEEHMTINQKNAGVT